MEASPVTVRFGGEVEQVDLNTFTRVLLDFDVVLRNACAEEDSNLKINTSIRAVRPGCLVVDLSVIANGLGGLFKDPSTALQTVEAAVTIAGGFYELKKHLGKHGKVVAAHAADGKTDLKTADGTVQQFPTNVVNIYINSPASDGAVNASFSSLEDDGRIDSISIESGGKVKFSASKDEFHSLAASPSYEGPDVRHEVVSAKLTVVKPYLGASTSRKWEFLYLGGKITANITDPDFMDNISHMRFTVGTVMSADLDITQKYNKDLHAYVNKSFTVTKVRGITDPPEEPPLF